MISSFILQNPIMDTCRISVESNHRMMIKNMIQLAMKQEVSWTMLSSFLDDVSSTIEKSKQVIRILLDEFENLSKYPNNGLRNDRVFSENKLLLISSERLTTLKEVKRSMKL